MAKVLLVDDELTMVQMVADLLREDGHEVFPFTNLNAALAGLTTHQPDLVITDLYLEKSNAQGLDIIKKARTLSPPAVVVVTIVRHEAATFGGALADPRLQSATRVHFVTHSLGGILVRSYFAEQADPRLGRVVMLGPPNQGSEVVDRLGSWWLFGRLNGPAGRQLGTGPDSVPNSLGPVGFELGVIAGNRSINWVNSLMIPGANDGKVSVARTRVDGMREHLVLPVSHPFLMRHPRVIEATLQIGRAHV